MKSEDDRYTKALKEAGIDNATTRNPFFIYLAGVPFMMKTASS